MPFSAATGATEAARAVLDVNKQIDTTAAVIHRACVCGFGMGSFLKLAGDAGTLLSARTLSVRGRWGSM
jgi:hypothetical protein